MKIARKILFFEEADKHVLMLEFNGIRSLSKQIPPEHAGKLSDAMIQAAINYLMQAGLVSLQALKESGYSKGV